MLDPQHDTFLAVAFGDRKDYASRYNIVKPSHRMVAPRVENMGEVDLQSWADDQAIDEAIAAGRGVVGIGGTCPLCQRNAAIETQRPGFL